MSFRERITSFATERQFGRLAAALTKAGITETFGGFLDTTNQVKRATAEVSWGKWSPMVTAEFLDTQSRDKFHTLMQKIFAGAHNPTVLFHFDGDKALKMETSATKSCAP